MRLNAAVRIKALTPPVDQDLIEIVIPAIFPNAQPVVLCQRLKVDLKLPYPYAPTWRVLVNKIMVYISINVAASQFWCCALVDLHSDAPRVKTFSEPLNLRAVNLNSYLGGVFKTLKTRILRWVQ